VESTQQVGLNLWRTATPYLKHNQLGVLEGTGEYFLVKSQPNASSELISSATESSTS